MCDICNSASKYRVCDFCEHRTLYVCENCLNKAINNMREYNKLIVEVID